MSESMHLGFRLSGLRETSGTVIVYMLLSICVTASVDVYFFV